jgi:AAA+ ATPase superfamily predicted ATPase
MNFYDRDEEMASLEEADRQSQQNHSMLTVVTGRRRIGKTSLLLRRFKGAPCVYLYVSRNNESALCMKFAQEINNSIDAYVPAGVTAFSEIFHFLMTVGTQKHFTLIIDEFQEFFYVNPAVFSEMQDIWDRYRMESHVNLVVCGSVNTLMHKIFRDAHEPLYGRADRIIKLMPFGPSVLRKVLTDYKPDYTNEDLLALYNFTGGVPKYIEMFVDSGMMDLMGMIKLILRRDMPFLDEGKAMLVQEFGKNYGNYFSILSAIASGKNTISEIMSTMGGIEIGGLLKRLEEDYSVIEKKRPIFAKPASQTVRYEISDNFLRFWFRYIDRYSNLIESNNLAKLENIITVDYLTYSGYVLERYFKDKMRESHDFSEIGSWWEGKNAENQNEIDIVGIYADSKTALVAEVKRQSKNFKPEVFGNKIEALRKKALFGYKIKSRCLSMKDM